jgi:diguanylate cyclase (GGDEF)-like protein
MTDDLFNYRKMTTQVVMEAQDEPFQPTSGQRFSVLVMLYGETIGRRYVIADKELVVGREEDCTLPLLDSTVSRAHCKLMPRNGEVTVQDLGSTNHTYVNGDLTGERLLRDGDQLRVGRTIFKFLSGDNIEHAYHEEVFRLMSTDTLTGAFNRQHFDKEIQRQFAHARRYERPVSLAMLDIDHFKYINDTRGHLFGDRVLAQLGALITSLRREQDVFCRYGGEEFAILLPETELGGAVEYANRVRKAVGRARFEYDGKVQPVSISIGVGQLTADMPDAKALVDAADNQLYEAKRNGRNRVEPFVPDNGDTPRPRTQSAR